MKKILGRRGSATIFSSLFSLSIIFTLLSLLFLNYFNYNASLQEMTTIEEERLLEHLIISDLTIDEATQTISHVVVNNTGTIDIVIRAIYKANSSVTTLICDPSTYIDARIGPREALSIPLPASFPIEPEAELIVVTERGVKTKQYEGAIIYGPSTIIIDIDPNKYYIGPMLLLFDEFWYRHTLNDGTLDPDDYWHNGWLIEKGFGSCTWNLTVTNVDDRNITLNHYSSFTLVPSDSPSNDLTWYMEPIGQPLTQTLVVNQTDTLLFKWTVPKDPEETGSVQSLTIPEATCMGFITLYGLFHEHDGSTTPYAQTIPFEAVIVIVT